VAVADYNGIRTANSDCAQVGIGPGALTTYLSVSVPVTAVDAAVTGAPEPASFALPGLGWTALAGAACRRVD
jgi:hypothetical protein